MGTALSYDACLMFAGGESFLGFSFGKRGTALAEVCFTTGALGYQHTITDPSFSGQIILFTTPHIGNVGINLHDNECSHVFARGVIFRERPQDFSHHSKIKDFATWLEENGLVGIYGVDTRAITRLVRIKGNQNGIIFPTDALSKEEALTLLERSKTMDHLELAVDASGYAGVHFSTGASANTGITGSPMISSGTQVEKKVCVIDFGIKDGIIRNLKKYFAVEIVSAKRGFASALEGKHFDGIVLSNGPGDPAATYEHLREDFSKLFSSGLPILGICLGHQLTVLAFGCKTKKMLVGHRGANHPVINLETGKVEITSQNHGFVLDESTLTDDVIVTHRSIFDGSVEGIKIRNKKIFSVQYHPEGSPGPHDSRYIFSKFFNEVSSQ